MNSPFRVLSDRPLFIVIGARSAKLLEDAGEDLGLVDVLLVERPPAATELDWLTSNGMLQRSFGAVIFDAADEGEWASVRAVTRALRATTSLTCLVCSDSRGTTERRGSLHRLARDLSVCVFDPSGRDGLRVALDLAVGLCRTGLTGFDIADVAGIACAGAVGRVIRPTDGIDSAVESAIVVMDCSYDQTLGDINNAAQALTEQLPNADLLVATPTRLSTRGLDVSVIGFSKSNVA
jgi:hypothetical protein